MAFSNICFHVITQIAFPGRCIVTLVAIVFKPKSWSGGGREAVGRPRTAPTFILQSSSPPAGGGGDIGGGDGVDGGGGNGGGDGGQSD